MRHRLGLATRTQISVCKSPFPSAGPAVSLFRGVTLKSGLGSYKVIDNGTIRKLGYGVRCPICMAVSCIIYDIK